VLVTWKLDGVVEKKNRENKGSREKLRIFTIIMMEF
jgi:hypothetical protein